MIGETISHYKILEKLGEGGMGVVYKAEDTKLKRIVALKFLPPELTRNEEAKERFVHEAQAASALDHPNICTIYEIDETEDGQTFIAMAYYEGETLKEKIEHGPLKLEETTDIAIHVAKGLARAHEAGITHRDIKPANIMITKRGEVKILDFGLAKLAGEVGLTKTGTTVGTVAYMSPEQARGETVDHRTDIWSLGVVMYEMLTGQRPFQSEYETAIVYLIMNVNPKPPRDLRKDIPPELEQIALQALEKDPESRYPSAPKILKDLTDCQSILQKPEVRLIELKVLLRLFRKPKIAITGVLIIIILSLMVIWFINRSAKVRWAREQAIPEIEQLFNETNYAAAYQIALKAEEYIPEDPKFVKLLSDISQYVSIQTNPPDADIYIKEYSDIDNDWQYIGQSNIDNLRMPANTFYRWKIEKAGYVSVIAVARAEIDTLYRKLDVKGTIPSGMVRVIGQNTDVGMIPDFFIDKYEVSNKQFKEFLDDGGYQKQEYWKHKFIKDGRVLTWEEAMAEFRDTTGRPGPATWIAGDYPDGQDDYPVTGVSWYEAVAYAEFLGKSLPTERHWYIAAGLDIPSNNRFPSRLIPLSNFKDTGPVPVGSSQGLNCFGAYDMAGNLKEWCWNEIQEGRVIRGGAWNDVVYLYSYISQLPPFDRSPKNGFRCVNYIDMDKIPEKVFQPVEYTGLRDYYKEEQVSDAIFQVYKNQFLYDKTGLDADVYETDESSEDWTIEKITFNAAYGNERVLAYLYLPKETAPPYQTVIFFPGATAARETSIKDNRHIFRFLDFILKNGRAVMYPVYKGTYERIDGITNEMRWPNQSHGHTEYLVKLVKDFSRSIDYLETRPDIDSNKLAYFGSSWGGNLGAIIPAVEERLKASILRIGGFHQRIRARPEADAVNYVSRVTIPVLMLNGRYDYTFPLETSVIPMFNLLGTPESDKLLKIYETDHYVPKNEIIKETLNWLDRYLGPVR